MQEDARSECNAETDRPWEEGRGGCIVGAERGRRGFVHYMRVSGALLRNAGGKRGVPWQAARVSRSVHVGGDAVRSHARPE